MALIIINVRFEVLTMWLWKATVFWDVIPCSLAEMYLRFRRTCCLRLLTMEEIGTFLQNVGTLLSDCMASHPRKLLSSSSLSSWSVGSADPSQLPNGVSVSHSQQTGAQEQPVRKWPLGTIPHSLQPKWEENTFKYTENFSYSQTPHSWLPPCLIRRYNYNLSSWYSVAALQTNMQLNT
jgi:hypothetical protein